MEKLESAPKKERDIEQDRTAFFEAMKSFVVKEIDAEFDDQSVESLVSELDESKLFLLGEMHGARENVDVIYSLFKKFGFKKLALEWDKILQGQVDEFLKTGKIDFESMQSSCDGRITAGHFALINKLKEEGLLEAVVCFDEEPLTGEWDGRDMNMAKNILESLSDSSTLVVAGNLHTKTEPFAFRGEEVKHHPMGENVKKQIENVPAGRIEYAKGQYHNIGIKDFRRDPDEPELAKAKFYKSADGIYSFDLPEAHAAVVPNPSERE